MEAVVVEAAIELRIATGPSSSEGSTPERLDQTEKCERVLPVFGDGGEFSERGFAVRGSVSVGIPVTMSGVHERLYRCARASRRSDALEVAQQMAAHESTRTTALYDRRDDEVAVDEVGRGPVR